MTEVEHAPPSIGERYASATESSNLRVVTHRRGDVDYLIALAWAPDTLGGALFRLMHEFDHVKRQHQADIDAVKAGMEAAGRLRLAAVAERGKDKPNEAVAEGFDDLAKLTDEDTKHAAISARAFILANMRSLADTKALLGRFAQIEATRQRFMGSHALVEILVGRTLEAWLDPLCPTCDGRMTMGGGRFEHSGPQSICRACKGTGERKNAIPRDEEQARFVSHLLSAMSEQMGNAEASVRRRMHDAT